MAYLSFIPLAKLIELGPHPEATAQWYSRYHLAAPAGLNNDLGQDLIDTVMQ